MEAKKIKKLLRGTIETLQLKRGAVLAVGPVS